MYIGGGFRLTSERLSFEITLDTDLGWKLSNKTLKFGIDGKDRMYDGSVRLGPLFVSASYRPRAKSNGRVPVIIDAEHVGTLTGTKGKKNAPPKSSKNRG